MRKLAVFGILAGLAGCITDVPVGAYMGECLSRPPYQAKMNYEASKAEIARNADLSTVINVPDAGVAERLSRKMGIQLVPVHQTSGVVLAELGPIDDLSRFMVVQSMLAMTDDPSTLSIGYEFMELKALKPMPKMPVYAPPRYAPRYQPGPMYQPQPTPTYQPAPAGQPGTETWEGMPYFTQ